VSESFVDLTYRGLHLGRRIKLTQIRPSTGHLELPAPMPVGTPIAIATDEGVRIDAVVTQVYEQVSGAERPSGMTVAPALADAAASAWWQARVALPETAPAPADAVPAPADAAPAPADVAPAPADAAPAPADAAPGPVVVRPRSRTPETAAAAAAAAAADSPAAAAADSPAAAVADSPAAAAADSPGPAAAAEPSDELAGSESEAPLVDDGKKTVMMQSVDLSALGLEAGASGQFATRDIEAAAAEGDDGDDGGEAGTAAAGSAAGSGVDLRQPVVPVQQGAAGKKRKKRR
jgi:hypothetical protein